jgi:hypothetical protein
VRKHFISLRKRCYSHGRTHKVLQLVNMQIFVGFRDCSFCYAFYSHSVIFQFTVA